MLTSLSRTQFETACKAYITAHPAQPSESLVVYPAGWAWNEHTYIPRLGFMSRSVTLSRKPAETYSDEEADFGFLPDATEDEATVHEPPHVLICIQYVVYSPTFQVPAFYFVIHSSNGVPLNLTEIMASSLLRQHAVPPSGTTTFALSEPGVSFPLLSQGDHPVLGTPAWYLHPCHTPDAVGEVISESQQEGRTEEQVLVRWLEIWFMVVGQVVNLGCGFS